MSRHTGAENDIKQVTDLARAMVTRWGMSPRSGWSRSRATMMAITSKPAWPAGSAALTATRPRRWIDKATRRIIDESYAKALDLLTRNRDRLEALSEALLREESLDEAQMLAATGLTGRTAPENPIAAAR